MEDLSKQFDEAMFGIYRRAKSEARYNATVFLQMLSKGGGLDTAKYLINSAKQSDGYAALLLRGRLDLTVEAMVVENIKWHGLFTSEELERARLRLKNNNCDWAHSQLGRARNHNCSAHILCN